MSYGNIIVTVKCKIQLVEETVFTKATVVKTTEAAASVASSGRGFINWKRAHKKFTSHKGSAHHEEAKLKWLNYVSGTNISTQLQRGSEKQQAANSQALRYYSRLAV